MKLSALLGLVLLAVAIAGLIITNPGPEAYTRYLSTQAENYLSEEVCSELPPGFGTLLAENCTDILASLESELDVLIRDRTERMNLAIASIYRTSLGVPGIPFLPEYRVETVGAVNQFFTYSFSRRS